MGVADDGRAVRQRRAIEIDELRSRGCPVGRFGSTGGSTDVAGGVPRCGVRPRNAVQGVRSNAQAFRVSKSSRWEGEPNGWDQATPHGRGTGGWVPRRPCRRIGIVWSVRHPTGARRVHPLADRLVRVGRNHIPSRGERTDGSESPSVAPQRVRASCTPACRGTRSSRSCLTSNVAPLAGSDLQLEGCREVFV